MSEERGADRPSNAEIPVTIHAGGPLDGVVTITALPGHHAHSLVEAHWTQDGERRSDSVEIDDDEAALEVARHAAGELAAGVPPDLTRD